MPVLDSLVDRTRSKKRVESASVGRRLMLLQNGFDNCLFLDAPDRRHIALFRFEIVHMESQNIPVLNGIRYRISVQLFFEHIFCSLVRRLFSGNLGIGSVLLEDRRTRKTKQLRVGEELFNGLVVISKLRTMALVKDEHHTHIADRQQPFLIIAAVLRV